MSSLPTGRETRKQLGAWYTPPAIVRLLVRWAVRSPDTRVLDPAVGDGDFLLEAARRIRTLGQPNPQRLLFGVDISPVAVTASMETLTAVLDHASSPTLITEDFFQVGPPGTGSSALPFVDAIVGNPPYIRYQRFAGRTRVLAVQRARDAGVRLSNLCSSWAAFVIHAATFLREGGRLGLVLPEELIHSSYAEPVRDFLRHTFHRTTVIDFDGYLFPRAQERVVLVLAEGKSVQPLGQLCLARVSRPEDVDDLDDVLPGGEMFEPGEQPDKWHAGAVDGATQLLDDLVAEGSLIPLAAVGKTGIGYVSGANDYFVLRPSETNRHGLPRGVLRPTVIAARQTRGALLSTADMDELIVRDEKCLLWAGDGLDCEAVMRYIKEGEQLGIQQRYKCRVRKPWYRVPGVTVPDAFLTYMSHEIPRLVFNGARATCSNNFLAVRFHSLAHSEIPGFVAAFYNSATMLSAERIGRHYGGGVLKLEPSEADRILVPNLSAVRSTSLRLPLEEIDQLLRSGNSQEALGLVDAALLRELLGLDSGDVQLIQESRTRRQLARARTHHGPARTEPQPGWGFHRAGTKPSGFQLALGLGTPPGE